VVVEKGYIANVKFNYAMGCSCKAYNFQSHHYYDYNTYLSGNFIIGSSIEIVNRKNNSDELGIFYQQGLFKGPPPIRINSSVSYNNTNYSSYATFINSKLAYISLNFIHYFGHFRKVETLDQYAR
jgi:hypothetical protein